MAVMKLQPPNNLHCHSFLKQHQKERSKNTKLPSPLLPTENFRLGLNLDLDRADLEQLFHRHGSHPPLQKTGRPSRERRPMRVAYQGGRGSYCQEAATEAFNASPFDSLIPCTSMEDAFLSLEDSSADRAVVPAENSVDGPIDRNLDLLLRHEDVKIVGELVLPVNHCLLSLPDASISDIRRIVSHPQALRHCNERIRKLGVEIDEVDNVADAAKFVKENGISDMAVIGSRMAGKEFGLRVLECNLQDSDVNYTRYLQLGLQSGSDSCTGTTVKTTVAFSLDKGVSDLFRAMWLFETRGIKVTRVEHRPNKANPIKVTKKESGKAMYIDYVFVFDLEGCGSDLKVRSAITGLKEFTGFVRVLGCYSSTCGNIKHHE